MEYTNEMNAVYANSITGNPLLDALPVRSSTDRRLPSHGL